MMETGARGEAQRRIPWHLVQPATFAIAVVLFVLRTRELADVEGSNVRLSATHQLWPVVLVLALSVSIRGRSTMQIFTAWFAGFFTAVWISAELGKLVLDLMSETSPYRLSVVVPLIEETSKMIPLLLVVWAWRRQRGSPGIIDLGLTGMAAGAGFAFHEDAMWTRVSSSGIDGTLGWLLPSMHSDVGLVAGHVVWTGIIGLAVGVAMARRRGWWWLVVGALVITVVDHGTWNNSSLRDDWRWLVGNGWLAVVLLLGGLLGGFVADIRSLRRIPVESRLVPGDVIRYARRGTSSNPVRRWWVGTRLMRAAAALAHGEASGAPVAPAVEPSGEAARA